MQNPDAAIWLTSEQVAVRYNLRPGTIKSWRRRGIGPDWFKISPIGGLHRPRVGYYLADLLAWEQVNNVHPIN